MEKHQRIIVKKKCKAYYGELELDNSHRFIQEFKGIKVSPLLQDIAAFTGQSECYQSSAEILEKILGIEISDSTIHKICQKFGKMGEKWLAQERNSPIKLQDIDPDEVIYAHCDGGMLLTRTDQWKEVKVGRVYSSKNLLKAKKNRGFIKKSWYDFHIGDHEIFENQMSQYLDKYEKLGDRLVFIVDGAIWIKNWIDAEYPCAQQILDYYHAIEHFGTFGKQCIPTKMKRNKWLEKIKNTLLKQGVEQAQKLVEKVICTTDKNKEEKRKLLNYIENNKDRMDYPEYKNKKLQIGSGAMEAAHRTLVQKRCKLSGQRWTIPGATRIINLRNLRMNDQWSKLTKHLQNVA